MTNIEQKALEMISAARKEHPTPDNYLIARTALCRAIEQHEAFRQEVSDIVHHYVYADGGPDDWEKLKALIIPKPKPDPLAEVMEKMGWYNAPNATDVENFRAKLDALGFEIREKNDG